MRPGSIGLRGMFTLKSPVTASTDPKGRVTIRLALGVVEVGALVVLLVWALRSIPVRSARHAKARQADIPNPDIPIQGARGLEAESRQSRAPRQETIRPKDIANPKWRKPFTQK